MCFVRVSYVLVESIDGWNAFAINLRWKIEHVPSETFSLSLKHFFVIFWDRSLVNGSFNLNFYRNFIEI